MTKTARSGVKWRHANPGSVSWVETAADRGFERREMDPLGAEVGTSDPYVALLSPDYSDVHGGSLFEDGSDPFHLADGCGSIDGMPASCSEMSERAEAGSVAAEFTLHDGDGFHFFQSLILSFGVGVFGVDVPYLKPNNEWRPGDPVSEVDWRSLAFSFQPQNQNTGLKNWEQKAVDDAIKEANNLTDQTKGKNQTKCDEALKALTNGKISSLNSLVSQYVTSGAGQNIFNGRKVPAASYGKDSPSVPAFVIGTGTSNAKTYLNSKFFNFTGAGATEARAIVLLHEAVHQFGGLRDIDFDPNTKKKNQETGSRNITNALIDNCAPALRVLFKDLQL